MNAPDSKKRLSRTWTILRPFPNAHWTLVVAGVLAVVLVLLRASVTACDSRRETYLLPAGTALVFTCLWLADLRRGSRAGWRRAVWVAGQAAVDLGVFLAVLLGVLLPVSLLWTGGGCTPDRAYTSDTVMLMSAPKTKITRRAQARGTLTGSGLGVSVPTGRAGTFGTILADGMIVVATEDPTAVLILAPSMVDGRVTWTCRGRPLRAMPSSCRR